MFNNVKKIWTGALVLLSITGCSEIQVNSGEGQATKQKTRGLEATGERPFCEKNPSTGTVRDYIPAGRYQFSDSNGVLTELVVRYAANSNRLTFSKCPGAELCLSGFNSADFRFEFPEDDVMLISSYIVEEFADFSNTPSYCASRSEADLLGDETCKPVITRKEARKDKFELKKGAAGWELKCKSFENVKSGPQAFCKDHPGATFTLKRVANEPGQLCSSLTTNPATSMTSCTKGGEGYCFDFDVCRLKLVPNSTRATPVACTTLCLNNPFASGCSVCPEDQQACGDVCCPTKTTHLCLNNACYFRQVSTGQGPTPGSSGFEGQFSCDVSLLATYCDSLARQTGNDSCTPNNNCRCECGSVNVLPPQ